MTRVAIVGAGPAGLAAAIRLVRAGVHVTVLDEQPRAGGQIYRNVTYTPGTVADLIGRDYKKGKALAEEFSELVSHDNFRYVPKASVWGAGENNHLSWSVDGGVSTEKFSAIILCNGSIERPVPISGWTLPGVMTAGAAQIMMKSAGVALPKSILLGAGPLLYLVAAQLTAFGNPPVAIFETQTFSQLVKSSRHLFPFNLETLKYLLKGVGYLAVLKKAGVKRYTGVSNIQISKQTDGLAVHAQNASGNKISAVGEHVLLHAGVMPNTQLTRALDIEHHWNALGKYFEPVTDKFGHVVRSDTNNIWIAGDGASILGADAAQLSGRVVAEDVLHSINHPSFDPSNLNRLIRQRRAYNPIRNFLDEVYGPLPEFLSPIDSTVVCRCEEVTAGEVRSAIELGAQGPNQLKAFTRCGMGNCQGRYCGTTITSIFSEELSVDPQAVGYYRIRTPIKPITLKELANYEQL